jgi:hypothetical protein
VTQQRSAQEGAKTAAERAEYYNSTILRKDGSTAKERRPAVDSTETTAAPTGPEPTRLRKNERRPKKNRTIEKIREQLSLATVTKIVIVPLTAWILFQLYTLNREVGQLGVQVQGVAKDQADAKGDLQRFETEIRSEIHRLDDGIDHTQKPSSKP